MAIHPKWWWTRVVVHYNGGDTWVVGDIQVAEGGKCLVLVLWLQLQHEVPIQAGLWYWPSSIWKGQNGLNVGADGL